MGWSPPLGAAARPRLALLGPARGRTLLAARRRPAAARSRALRKPGRRPNPDPSPDPAAQPRGPQPTRARPARAQPTTAWPAAAALTSARRPAPALPAPGSRRDRTSPLAVGGSGCWEGRAGGVEGERRPAGAGRANSQCSAEIAAQARAQRAAGRRARARQGLGLCVRGVRSRVCTSCLPKGTRGLGAEPRALASLGASWPVG